METVIWSNCLQTWHEQEITLNVLSTGMAGLRAALRILKPKAPVTNSNIAWSGYTCGHILTVYFPTHLEPLWVWEYATITHSPPERIVGSVCLTQACRAVSNSQHPSLPAVHERQKIHNENTATKNEIIKIRVSNQEIHTCRNCGLGAGRAVNDPQGVLTIVSNWVQHSDWIRKVSDVQSHTGTCSTRPTL